MTFVVADVATIITQVRHLNSDQQNKQTWLKTRWKITGASLVGASESAVAQKKHPVIDPDAANDITIAGLAVQVCRIPV